VPVKVESMPATLRPTPRKTKKSQENGENAINEEYTYTFTVEPSVSINSALALRHYFDNGGGPCYILAFSHGNQNDEFADQIRKHPEISLLVFAIRGDASGYFPKEMHAAMDELLREDKGYFLITHTETDADAPLDDELPSEKSQTGFYYPYLKSPYKYWRMDDLVEITGYIDAEGNDKITLTQLATRNPQLYAQIGAKVDEELAKLPVPNLPPSTAFAGAYCRTDRERGVWKAPANVALRGVSALAKVVGEEEHGHLNSMGINVIRWFADRGAVIYGARTLVPEAETAWRYIPVRRLFGSAERDIKEAMQPLVFEPNNAPTWEAARSAIDNYLNRLWRQGALLGDTPAEAYFVRVGKGITMDDTHIKQGIMIVKIGMAAVRPAEFIILEFTQQVGQV
jgi:uncharacterized protein